MDHQVKVMNSHRKVAFSRLFNHRRFENAELEHLYQRYIFKLQQASIISSLALLACLSLSMGLLQFYFTDWSFTIIGVYCSVQFLIFFGLFLLSWRMHETQLLALCYVILLFCVIFCAILSPIRAHLPPPSWNPAAWWSLPHTPSEGVWPIVFVVFLTYTMLPIKVTISLLFGLLLCASHLAITMTSVASGSPGGGEGASEDDRHQYYVRKQVCI